MLSPSMMLDTWEAGRRRHPVDRALLLLSLAGDERPEALPDVPLGEVNRRLMALRRERFGDRLEVWADCPACGERMSLDLAADDLPPAPAVVPEVEVGGHRFRRPTSRDLADGVIPGTRPDTRTRTAAAGVRAMMVTSPSPSGPRSCALVPSAATGCPPMSGKRDS